MTAARVSLHNGAMRWIAATLLLTGCSSLAADKSHVCPPVGVFSEPYLCPELSECADPPVYCGKQSPDVTACDQRNAHDACTTSDGKDGACIADSGNLVCTTCTNDIAWCQCTTTSDWCKAGHWAVMTSPVSTTVISIWASDIANAYAGTDHGELIWYDGVRWQAAPGYPTLAGEVHVSGIWGTGPDDVFVVTSEPRISHYDGAMWKDMSLPSGTPPLTAIAGTGPGNVVAVGGGGGILTLSAGTWSLTTVMVSTVYPPLNATWGATFAVGISGTVAQQTTGWSASRPLGTATLYGIWGSGSNDVYAIGTDGSTGMIGHYTTSWSGIMPFVGTSVLRGIWGTGADDIYTVGDSAAIWHFAASMWTQQDSPQSTNGQNLWAVGGSGPTNVFVGGDVGAIWHYRGP